MPDLSVRCCRCGRTTRLDSIVVLRLRAAIEARWNEPVDSVFRRAGQRLKCSACGARDARLLAETIPDRSSSEQPSRPRRPAVAERSSFGLGEYEEHHTHDEPFGVRDEPASAPTGYDDDDYAGDEPWPYGAYYDVDEDEWIEPGEEDEDNESFDDDYNEDERDDWP